MTPITGYSGCLAGLAAPAAARRGPPPHGAKVLADSIYAVGPVTALALICWLGVGGRFNSARKAVRFAGLDTTVYSSDGKRSPGHLSRQGPPVLRWAVYEAGKTHARPAAPDHGYCAAVKDRKDGKRADLPGFYASWNATAYLTSLEGNFTTQWRRRTTARPGRRRQGRRRLAPRSCR
jgi:hypothetical protein